MAIQGGGANMIPYLTVYKDGNVIDSICLQGRDTWVAGRHADCDIWVGHASTSRRHLEIQVLHATMELLLVDLQSGIQSDDGATLPICDIRDGRVSIHHLPELASRRLVILNCQVTCYRVIHIAGIALA